MDGTELTAVALVLFLGALTRSVFGFGDAAVAMPLLALLSVRVAITVPLVGLVGLVVASTALLSGWRAADLRALKWLTASTFVGVPFGVVLVTRASETVVTRCLGLLLVVYGLFSLLGPSLPRLRHHGWSLASGFAAGCLGSAYNFNGVPVAVYGVLRRWPPDRFRSTMQAHFAISSVLVVAGQGAGGMWTAGMFRLFLLALPGVLLAVPLGRALHQRLPAERFTGCVHALITLLGVLLLL